MSTAELSRATIAPALSGRDPLGFLAALGTLRALTSAGLRPRLRWERTSGCAVFEEVGELDEIVEQLCELVETLPPSGLAIGLPPDLPPAKQGSSGSDPARLAPRQLRELVTRWEDDDEALDWIRALWTDLGMDKDGLCARTPFSAPTGQQTLRSMFEKPSELVRAAPSKLLTEAFQSWRRVEKFTGENLDIRALRLAAEQADGKATTYGVPGATWLALNALPLFPMGGDGERARTVGWYRVPNGPRRSMRTAFAWPIWHRSLDLAAARVLVRHPIVAKGASLAHEAGRALLPEPGQRTRPDTREWAERTWRDQADALGVDLVATAGRWAPPGAKAAGYLVAGPTWR